MKQKFILSGQIIEKLKLRDSKPNNPRQSKKVMTFKVRFLYGDKEQFVKCELWQGLAVRISEEAQIHDMLNIEGRLRKTESTWTDNYGVLHHADKIVLVADKVEVVAKKCPRFLTRKQEEVVSNEELQLTFPDGNIPMGDF